MPRGSPFTRLCQQLAQNPLLPFADLHAHSTASDGDWTPSQLVAFAKQAKLQVLALTDHDTVAGWPEAQAQAHRLGVDLCPGVEWSTVWKDRGLHVLGLGINPGSAGLQAALSQTQQLRQQRYRAYLQVLITLGLSSEHIERFEWLAQNCSSVGRRHLAKGLIQTGQAADFADAFARWLRPAQEHVQVSINTPLAEACRWIHESGGVAILAHPPADFGRADYQELQQAGLDGIEVEFPRASADQRQTLRQTCEQLGWLVSGGSDCHGSQPPERWVGRWGITRRDWELWPARLQALVRTTAAWRSE